MPGEFYFNILDAIFHCFKFCGKYYISNNIYDEEIVEISFDDYMNYYLDYVGGEYNGV